MDNKKGWAMAADDRDFGEGRNSHVKIKLLEIFVSIIYISHKYMK